MHPDTPQPPVQAILLFDGGCGLCDRAVRFVAVRDPVRRFRFVPLQSPEAERLLAPLGIDTHAPNSIVLVADGMVLTKSTAVLWILAQLNSPWRWLRVFRYVPRPIRDRVYELVARNRLRWFGTKTACLRPASTSPHRKAGRSGPQGIVAGRTRKKRART